MAKAKTNGTKEVAVIEDVDMALVPNKEAFHEMQVNLEGIEPVFPQIKIIHQGSIFEMPDGAMVQSFRGVIIDSNAANAYWIISFEDSGGGSVPDCFSPDSKHPDVGILEPQNKNCKECEKNQFGSEVPKKDGEEAAGKACKNMKRIHVIVEGSFLPYRLSLSPANLRPTNMFLTVLASQGLSYLHVVTEFSLKKVSNKNGIEYSEIVLKKDRVIENKAVVNQLKNMKTSLLTAMRGQVITQEEYAPTSEFGKEE